MLVLKRKKDKTEKRSSDVGHSKYRYLVVVNVVGSSGPVRFLVNEDDLVYGVIDTALKVYARQGRLPPLGTRSQDFLLYCIGTSQALSPLEAIGSSGGRNFILQCKKQTHEARTMEAKERSKMAQNGCFSWKSCLSKNLINLKMLCHG